jgi:hypothetical protein
VFAGVTAIQSPELMGSSSSGGPRSHSATSPQYVFQRRRVP